MKKQILREIDETGLLTGSLVRQALLANDRAKYLMTLLQLAFEQARSPRVSPDNLSEERRAVELDDPALDSVIPKARRQTDRTYAIEGARRVLRLLTASCSDMLEPIGVTKAPEFPALSRRLQSLCELEESATETRLTEEWLERVTSGSRGNGDTLHLYVMDAHKVLNRIQSQFTHTHIDGVPTLGIEEQDHPLVQAFVAGVRRTQDLKLDHPGLDTTASRYGGRLVIQNDVGVTDSHVVVVAVSELRVEITYSDLHERRLKFFKSMLERYTPEWKQVAICSSDKLEEGERFYVLRGFISCPSSEAKEDVLRWLGSRLVFLIDWNKARKRLRNFVSNKIATTVLEKAAELEVGHRCFLELGGEELVFQALDVAASEHLRYGEPFQNVVASETAQACFLEILKICHEGITNGDSLQVVRDRIIACLTRAFVSKIRGSLVACRKQAGLVVEAALTLEQITRLVRLRKDSSAFVRRSQERIDAWERQADDILNRVRRKESQRPSLLPVRELSDAIDDALDQIDEAAYFLGDLRCELTEAGAVRVLSDLASNLVRCAQEFYKALSAASEASSRRSEEDLPEFFESIGRLDVLAKRKNERARSFLNAVFELDTQRGPVARLREIAGRISSAADHLRRGGFLLYDSIFTPGQLGH